MNIEFHYYTVFFLAKHSGFEFAEAEKLACSSQFVDSNIIQYRIETENGPYTSLVTQNYGFWDENALRQINVPFHFIPGEPPDRAVNPRKDAKWHSLLTRANAPLAKKLLVSAMRSGNLYQMGIALHAFADTWAHQNFCGIESECNVMDSASLLPAIGHAQALTKPDPLDSVWQDPRLTQTRINNRERFYAAAGKVYRYLCLNRGQSFANEELVISRLKDIHGPPGAKKAGERILDMIIAEDIPRYEHLRWVKDALKADDLLINEKYYDGYSKVLWLRDELLHGNDLFPRKRIKARSGFRSSGFYQWMEAAKTHQKLALDLIGPLYPTDSRQ